MPLRRRRDDSDETEERGDEPALGSYSLTRRALSEMAVHRLRRGLLVRHRRGQHRVLGTGGDALSRLAGPASLPGGRLAPPANPHRLGQRVPGGVRPGLRGAGHPAYTHPAPPRLDQRLRRTPAGHHPYRAVARGVPPPVLHAHPVPAGRAGAVPRVLQPPPAALGLPHPRPPACRAVLGNHREERSSPGSTPMMCAHPSETGQVVRFKSALTGGTEFGGGPLHPGTAARLWCAGSGLPRGDQTLTSSRSSTSGFVFFWAPGAVPVP